jgi:type I restriction enzyme, S subunit
VSELPHTWTKTTLKTVANLVTGNTPSTKSPEFYGGDVPFVKPGDLDGAAPIIRAEQYLSVLGAGQSRLVRAGSTLVSCIGNLGKVGFAGVPLATNQQINSAEFYSGMVDDRYGYYLCKTLKPWMERESSATTIAILNKGKFGEALVPLAPIEEQKRIADKLDTLLTRVDTLNIRLSRVAPILKRFRQSVLAAATSGRLTEDWRDSQPFDASEKKLSEIGTVSGGLTKNSKRESLPARQPYLRVANVYANELRLDNVTDIGLTESEFNKTKLEYGDLLIVEGNGSIDQIGRVAMWRNEIANCCHQNHLIRWRCFEVAAPLYVLMCLMSPAGRSQIVNVASSTTGLHTLSVSKVGEISVLLPSLKEQTEIVRRVETLFAFADRLEARLQTAQTTCDRLTPSLLAKAFRGELVPQDPSDEPAAELLRRLVKSNVLSKRQQKNK